MIQVAPNREDWMLEVERQVKDSLKADFQRLERTVSKALENFKPVDELLEELRRLRSEVSTSLVIHADQQKMRTSPVWFAAQGSSSGEYQNFLTCFRAASEASTM
jgi:hypothetical protein